MKSRAKTILVALAAALFLCFGCARSQQAIPLRPDNLGLEAVKFSPPVPESWTLDNGLTVFFLHDRELPIVSGTLYIPGGSLWEPTEFAGLASACGAQMREGGIPGYSPGALDKHLSDLAARVESSFGDEFGTVSFFGLSEDFDELFGIFSKVVTEPRFDNSRLLLWKSLAAEGIKRRRDDPSTMATMSLRRIVYGENSPFARSPTFDSVSRISVKDLRDFHSRYVRPGKALLAVSGSITKEQLQSALGRRLAAWDGSAPGLTPPAVTQPAAPGIYVLNRDLDQATVVFAHLGPPRLTDDMHAMTIFNRVFGSAGFESVLFSEIRTRLGLAYAVDGGLQPGLVAGLFEVGLGTRVEEVSRAIRAVLQLTEDTKQRPLDAALVAPAKTAVERSFVFKFAEKESVVTRAALLKILGYPEDFDRNYLARIEAVSPADASAVAKRWIRPEDLSIVIVGRVSAADIAGEFEQQFKVFEMQFDTEPRISAQPVR